MEIIQFTFVYLVLGTVSGLSIEWLFPKNGSWTLVSLIFFFSLRLIVLAIVTFYVHKIAGLLPFLFCDHLYHCPYKPGLKGEPKIGAAVIFGLAFIRTQHTFLFMFDELVKRLFTLTF